MGDRTYTDIGGARLDFSAAMSYGDYLKLDGLLACQQPLTRAHDEMLFVCVHHVSELWMKLIIHELRAARERIRTEHPAEGLKMLSRVRGVLWQMIGLWDVLSTMTPADYLAF
ncbi:MAG: hypothetical protein JNM82_10825, partial [Rhodocyclaceae bacterium]|nr:hypothetical protein [Rhodocyclaceae bacterium]